MPMFAVGPWAAAPECPHSRRIFLLGRRACVFSRKSQFIPDANCQKCSSELETSMNQVQVEQKSYQMPPQDGFTVAHFLTVADIERSARFYEKVFGGRILSM